MIRKDTRPYETEEQRWELRPQLNSLQKKVLARLFDYGDPKILTIVQEWAPNSMLRTYDFIVILYLVSYDFSDLETAGFFHSPYCGFWQENIKIDRVYHDGETVDCILNKFVYYSGHKTYEQMMDDFKQNIRPKMEDEAIQQAIMVNSYGEVVS